MADTDSPIPPSAGNDAQTLVVSDGEYVFREGDAGSELYIVEEGQVELFKGENDPAAVTLDVGDFFGERSLLEGDPREVSARAITTCRLLRLDLPTLEALFRHSPEAAILLLRKLGRRVEAGRREEAPRGAPSPVFVHEPSGTRFPLRAESTIGRVNRSTGVAPDIDLTPFDADKTLSRRHARVALRPDGFFLREDEGRNGTFVNDQRLGAGGEARLTDGDRVRFGLVEVVFRLT
jgi:hypothetical protein